MGHLFWKGGGGVIVTRVKLNSSMSWSLFHGDVGEGNDCFGAIRLCSHITTGREELAVFHCLHLLV
jgi:hypothetical protein